MSKQRQPISKRAGTSLDDLPTRGLVLTIPAESLLAKRKCHLALDHPPEPGVYMLVEGGRGLAVVEVGKLHVVRSTRGHEKTKGYPFVVHGVFKDALRTNLPKTAAPGVHEDLAVRVDKAEDVTNLDHRERADKNDTVPTAGEAGGADLTASPSIGGEEAVGSVPAEVAKPFAGYETFDDCVADQVARGNDEDAARAICGKLQAEAEGTSKRRYSKADIVDVARHAATTLAKQDEDEVLEDPAVGEGGVHMHELMRSDSKTASDGAHQHLFLLPSGEIVATAFDGEHEHTLKAPEASVAESDVSTHSHAVLMPDGETITTVAGGEHMHALQVKQTAFDGIHQHALELPDGTTILSLTPGEFWALTEGEDTDDEDDEDDDSNADKRKRMDDKIATLAQVTRGLKLSAPALSLVDTDDDTITLMAHGPLSDEMKRAIEKSLASRLPESVSSRLRLVGDAFGVPRLDTVPFAQATIDFADAFEVVAAKGDDMTRHPVGKQRAVMQYAFDGEGFAVVLRMQAEDEVISWTLDAGRRESLHEGITTPDAAAAVVKSADLDGSRYQQPLRGVATPAEPSVSGSLVMLEHEGRVYGADVSGLVVTAAKAVVEYGLQRDGFHEYFFSGNGALTGIAVAKRDPSGAWSVTVQKTPLPAVLTDEAVEAGVMPPAGHSGLPASLQRDVPPELQYWRAATPKAARALRDTLVKSRLITADTVAMVGGELRRVYVTVQQAIDAEPPTVPADAPAPEPPPYTDPVRKVARLLPDEGASVVLFDRSLAATTPASGVADLATRAAKSGDDFLISYPDSPGARLSLARCGRLFKIAGHGDTLFVTSAPISDPAIAWLAEPAPMHEIGASERVTALLKRMGGEHRVRVMKTPDERFVLGIVLEPETVDAQNDIYSAEEIRKAAHLYMEEFGHIKLMHRGAPIDGKVKILENYIAPVAMEIDGQPVKKGTWLLGVRVLDDSLWNAVKSGDLTGFSIGGLAVKTPL